MPPTDFAAAEPWGNAGFNPSPIGYQFSDHIIQSIVTRDPAYDIRAYDVSRSGYIGFDTLAKFDARTAAGNASDPARYGAFIQSGRKMIIYHGYSDPALTPFRTINLYHQLAAIAGGYGPLQRSVALFMAPGLQHCFGGPGPNVFDTLAPLERWVEQGVTPTSIPAAHYANDDLAQPVDRTMPLCPYPTEATYAGAGDVASAANWSCSPNERLLQVGPNGTQAGLDAN